MKLDRVAVLGSIWALFGVYGACRAGVRLSLPADLVTRGSVACVALVNAAAVAGGIGLLRHRRWGASVLEYLAWFGAGLMSAVLVGGAAVALWMTPRAELGWDDVAALVAALANLALGGAVFGVTIRVIAEARAGALLR